MFRGGLRTVLGALVAFAAIAALPPQPAGAEAGLFAAAPVSAPPQAFILVDAGNGRVLASGNDHQAIPPASTAKLMTALTAVERLPPNALITVSPLDASVPASKINMVAGQKWTLDDTLACLMMVSANDAAYALAENTSGSLAAFAQTETATAKRFGLRDSTFADPAGLDDGNAFRGGPRMSAYDIAISARNVLAVPELALFAAQRQKTFVDPAGNRRYLTNHNKMLPGNGATYPGTTGMKTGYTDLAGHTFVATATRNGRTLIAVIMNTWDTYGWAEHYLDEGFAMPANAKGTGEKLPPVRVDPYARRLADQRNFVALTKPPASSDIQSVDVATTTSTTPAERAAFVGSTTTVSTAAPTSAPSTALPHGTVAPTATLAAKSAKKSSSLFSMKTFAIVVLLLAIVLVLLRRRAVRRQRARRIAQRKARASAMRRGSLQVVDGRYRIGDRTGPPLESHVRLHRERRPPKGNTG